MFPYHLLEDPSLKKYIRAVTAKEYLFQQGELGNSMFIIIEGSVALYQTSPRTTRLIDMANKGEMLGEKAVVLKEPYKRTVSAQAVTDVIVLELDSSNIKFLKQRLPDFMSLLLRYVIQRLDKANELILLLQVKDDTERILQYLLFWAKHNGKKGLQGVEFRLSPADIASTVNVPEEMVEESIRVLTLQKILMRKNDLILIPDESAVLAYLPTLKERVAA